MSVTQARSHLYRGEYVVSGVWTNTILMALHLSWTWKGLLWHPATTESFTDPINVLPLPQVGGVMSTAQERSAPLINFSEHLCHNEMQARVPPREDCKTFGRFHSQLALSPRTCAAKAIYSSFQAANSLVISPAILSRCVRSFCIQTLTIRTPFSTLNILPVIPQIINSISDQITLVFLPVAVTD